MRKLTESDKQEILKLYRETAETTSTLAERYGVSNSTISRLLKSTLPEDQYEYLVSLKRAARTPEGRAQVSYEQVPEFNEPSPQESLETTATKKPSPTIAEAKPVVEETVNEDDSSDNERWVKRRSSAEVKETLPEPITKVFSEVETPKVKTIPSPLESENRKKVNISHLFDEDLLDDADDLDDEDDDDDLLDLDYEDDDLDDDEDDDEDELPPPVIRKRRSANEALVQVLPLSAASLPRTCYLVIDRSAELITRPLKDFGDLGEIPSLETQERTLPIFDNHRVAKRFSTRRDRVIKVPDSAMLHKARYHLEAKGITRLLIDGQVYSLSRG